MFSTSELRGRLTHPILGHLLLTAFYQFAFLILSRSSPTLFPPLYYVYLCSNILWSLGFLYLTVSRYPSANEEPRTLTVTSGLPTKGLCAALAPFVLPGLRQGTLRYGNFARGIGPLAALATCCLISAVLIFVLRGYLQAAAFLICAAFITLAWFNAYSSDEGIVATVEFFPKPIPVIFINVLWDILVVSSGMILVAIHTAVNSRIGDTNIATYLYIISVPGFIGSTFQGMIVRSKNERFSLRGTILRQEFFAFLSVTLLLSFGLATYLHINSRLIAFAVFQSAIGFLVSTLSLDFRSRRLVRDKVLYALVLIMLFVFIGIFVAPNFSFAVSSLVYSIFVLLVYFIVAQNINLIDINRVEPVMDVNQSQ